MPPTQTVLDRRVDLPPDAPAERRGDPWYEGRLATLDLEATGVDPATARILEVALHLDVPGRAPERLIDTLVDPGPDVVIPPAAAAVHGITRERPRAEAAPPAAEVLPRVQAALHALAVAGTPLVIYNARYDWPLLAAELRRLAPRRRLAACHLIDPLVLDRHCDRLRPGARTLEAACGVYDVLLVGAHRAGTDCAAAVGVARAIGRRYAAVGRLAPEALQGLQTTAHATWRDDVNAYRERVGAARPPVRGAWPGVTG
jgi:DNA polymerase III subunit epsilon